jgi:hypothetical protein
MQPQRHHHPLLRLQNQRAAVPSCCRWAGAAGVVVRGQLKHMVCNQLRAAARPWPCRTAARTACAAAAVSAAAAAAA